MSINLGTMSIAFSMVEIKGLRASKRSSTAFYLALPFTLLCHSYFNYDEKEELAELANAVPKLSTLQVRAIKTAS